jgi:hypothetical protein
MTSHPPDHVTPGTFDHLFEQVHENLGIPMPVDYPRG